MTGHSADLAAGTGPGPAFWILTVLLISGALYATGVQRMRARGDNWSPARSSAAGGGLLCLAIAVQPVPDAALAFPAHVVQHLLMAMLGPLLLALSAPITLALRVVSKTGRRLLLTVLHSPIARLLTLAPVVLAFDFVGLYFYYLTPVYAAAHHQPWLQGLIGLHMFLAGCLLSWYLVGRDQVVHRPSIRSAITVLLIAAVAHDILAKLLVARQLPTTAGSAEIEVGAQIMYYGGNLIELLTATILMTSWYNRGGRLLRREARRSRPLGLPATGAGL